MFFGRNCFILFNIFCSIFFRENSHIFSFLFNFFKFYLQWTNEQICRNIITPVMTFHQVFLFWAICGGATSHFYLIDSTVFWKARKQNIQLKMLWNGEKFMHIKRILIYPTESTNKALAISPLGEIASNWFMFI